LHIQLYPFTIRYYVNNSLVSTFNQDNFLYFNNTAVINNSINEIKKDEIEKELVRVCVKTFTGKVIYFHVDIDQKLTTLFDKIWEEEGMQPIYEHGFNKNSLRLIYQGGDCPTYNSMQEGQTYSDVTIRRPNINKRDNEIILNGDASFFLVMALNYGESKPATIRTIPITEDSIKINGNIK